MKRTRTMWAITALIPLALAGCEQSSTAVQTLNSQKTAPAALVSPTPAASPAPSAKPGAASSPDTKEQDSIGQEVGSPKEEPVIVKSSQSARVSALKPVFSVAKGTVAITIDDGPTKDTSKLLKILKELDTHVTFFFLGQNAEKYHESVSQAVYDGHVVGYHSDTHPQMTKMSYDDQLKEFKSGLDKLAKWDKNPITLFRPPYGAYNNDTKLITEDNHMSMVLWNEDTKDWSSTNAAAIAKSVLAQVQSGSIIVMHDHPSTIAALPDIIKGIKSKGYKLVTIPSK
ncbi:polysaccharide deacetylase family protein [Paenibacillus alba]|uniref:Polysaccharide deacetylase family protein n=1 Tax=Paenibacillus alba TaxID=1197127 RepID=A0ABU6GE07_9BACL|nr:polysaccharide deacetylase family protein [Paenibacillus alba]MEC0232447.1 polysaccharide deacetylase family protein [Paenibacillus alba]